jgi:hypothetical protein
MNPIPDAGNRRRTRTDGTVALSVGKIEAGLSNEAIDSFSPVFSSDVGVCRIPVPDMPVMDVLCS